MKGAPPRPPTPPPPRPTAPPVDRKGRIAGVALLLLATALGLAAGFVALRIGARRSEGQPAVESVAVPEDSRSIEALAVSLDKEVKALRAQNKRLEDKMAKVRPRGLYVVIDVGADKLFVMQDDKVLREAICSTGSGVRLADPNTPRSWVFDTPRGELTVRGKTTDPIWVKPDWAFIETGEGIPHSRDDRMEEGVLGDYALDLGQGYLIHGTLFERALGLHVTHGCVRMGSKDLEYLFKTVKPGTKVYIV